MAVEIGVSSRTLVVALHGYTRGPASLAHVERAIRACIPGAHVVVPKLPLSTFSCADPNAIVADLLQQVDALFSRERHDRIILVGYSMGGLLARKLYIAACGNNDRAPLEPVLSSQCAAPREWAARVERIVLLAGMNNGWSIDYHMGLWSAFKLSAGVLLGRLLHFVHRGWPTIFNMRRGAPFLIQLRVQWLIMRRLASARGVGATSVIQLLGTVDDLVSPRDNVDVVTGQDFYFLDVPKSGHLDVVTMDESPAGSARTEVFQRALSLSPAQLKESSVLIADIDPVPPRHEVEELVFVIHGIRDEGFWTEKIARAVMREGHKCDRRFARETSTYGYFGMLPFLSSWQRRQKVEWLMNRYAEALAHYPNLKKIHYVGHSNGTYLLAKAIEQYPCCQFNRIVFAGSVVPSTYDWSRYINRFPPQAEEVLNYAATGDWVVAYFPNCFEFLGIADLGGAGHLGFKEGSVAPEADSKVVNVEYVVGAHSAALTEENWSSIARFIVHGHGAGADPLCGARTWKRHSGWVGFFGKFPPIIWLCLAALLATPIGLLYYAAGYHWQEWWLPTALVAYVAALLYVGNRL